ncbi:alpha/beta fold hydrolase [Streptomyces sp. NBC_00264]|uniref:alpha/beta fold hydrolase n=1 Tax=unclassified Streptomyces TaxID=2593676 RepID=UPI0022543E11|nr:MULTISPECIES: alpha/beta fold hydrolase [unclassified Streptomyces]MCX5164923.1 alpha/beta fold hydrolase [Streptomyces sp. NBC_00305]MCX5223447.1 alpha/beta fold hydrolase [Streptomyces sp. NBC_00264]
MNAASELNSIETEDGRLVHRDIGEGPLLVLLHGGFVDHRMWDDQVPELARRHRVIVPDARGHGGSANATRPFRHADDVAALLRHLDAGPAVLAGLSMGAATAVDTALEHPDLVRALVVSGAGTSEPEFVDPWCGQVLAAQARALEAGDIEGWLDAFMLFAAGPHRTLDDVDGTVVRRVREMAARTLSKHRGDEPDLRVPVPDTWTRAAGIEVPVLAVNGGVDGADQLAMARRLVRTVAHGREMIVEGAAHYPNMEKPDAFGEILGDFLAGLRAR